MVARTASRVLIWDCVLVALWTAFALVVFSSMLMPAISDGGPRHSHTRKIFEAVKVYSEDFDGYLPNCGSSPMVFEHLVKPYAKSVNYFRCPADRRPILPTFGFANDGMSFVPSVMLNPNFAGGAIALSQLKALENPILVYDVFAFHKDRHRNVRFHCSSCLDGSPKQIRLGRLAEFLNPWIPSAIGRNP